MVIATDTACSDCVLRAYPSKAVLHHFPEVLKVLLQPIHQQTSSKCRLAKKDGSLFALELLYVNGLDGSMNYALPDSFIGDAGFK